MSLFYRTIFIFGAAILCAGSAGAATILATVTKTFGVGPFAGQSLIFNYTHPDVPPYAQFGNGDADFTGAVTFGALYSNRPVHKVLILPIADQREYYSWYDFDPATNPAGVKRIQDDPSSAQVIIADGSYFAVDCSRGGTGTCNTVVTSVSTVPLPASGVLWLAGLAGAALIRGSRAKTVSNLP